MKINSKTEDKLRNFTFKVYKHIANTEKLFARMEVCEIGFTGNVSVIDESLAKEQGCTPLNKFERWLVNPIIESEKQNRRYIFAKTASDFLGEDIDDWL